MQTFLIQSDSSYRKSCGNLTCSPCLFLPPSQGMFPLLCVLQLWQYPAYERSFQTPLNSYLKCFILYSDVGQFTSLTLPPAVISLCAIILQTWLYISQNWWCLISRYSFCLFKEYLKQHKLSYLNGRILNYCTGDMPCK